MANKNRKGNEEKKPSSKRGCLGTITSWATNNLPFVFGLLRVIKPIVVFKNFALVTRFADVDEVLHRDDAFMVTYAEKMKVVTDGNNFFLGMGPTPEYVQDVSNMRIAARDSDANTIIVPMVDNFATEIVAQSNGKLDAVEDLSKIVSAKLVEEYLGITAPTREDLIEWTTNLFYYLFFPGISEEAIETARECASKARQRIDEIIVSRKQSREDKDDVLGRLLKMQPSGQPGLTDVDIRNNLLGIIIGAIPTTSKATALALDYLLDHPEIMAQARSAAQKNDLKTLNKYVLECLRFNVFGPGLFRECVQDYRIAKGAWRAKTIRKGTRVFVATQSAMLDGRELTKPRKFDVTRPEYQYMPYGHGMHRCFGKYINDVQIATILKALLIKEDLKRSPGTAGRLEADSRSFPIHLKVSFLP